MDFADDYDEYDDSDVNVESCQAKAHGRRRGHKELGKVPKPKNRL
jgi:hypothetical protein